MALTTSKGFFVWNLTTDPFSHTQLAANWELLDTLLSNPPSSVQISTTVPSSGTFAGELVMLSAATSGFPAWTLIRYDGSNWRAVGPLEILPAVPSSGNYAGRVVVLSSSSGGFSAWNVIIYNGTSWNVIGGFTSVNTGNGSNNIQGLSTTGDVQWATGARGPVLTDRTSGTEYRLYINNGLLYSEVVS